MSIDQRYEEFDRKNPEIYSTLKSTALKWVARGAKRISVKALYEVARMTHWLSTTSGDPWTLNNDYTSRYARRLAAEPELRGLIELRAIKGGSSGGSTGATADEDFELGLDF